MLSARLRDDHSPPFCSDGILSLTSTRPVRVSEGLAVSLPLLRLGMSRRRAFFFGQLSGMAEPVGGVVGALAVSYLEPLLPYALALAGGAMLFVVAHDLIPETRQRGGSPNLACWALVIGFAIMMSLDAGL